MECPKCGVELHCPCISCRKNNKDKVKWIWLEGKYTDCIKCPQCGFTQHCDYWQDIEYSARKKVK